MQHPRSNAAAVLGLMVSLVTLQRLWGLENKRVAEAFLRVIMRLRSVATAMCASMGILC